MSRVLVTGGAGFIGSHLVDGLVSQGYKVDVVDDLRSGDLGNLSNHTYRTVPGVLIDQLDINLKLDTPVRVIMDDFASNAVLNRIAAGKYDVIFHLAAEPSVPFSVEWPALTTDENFSKYVKLLTSARGNTNRVVFASSAAVYGDIKQLPIHEDLPTKPVSPYGLQKKMCEEMGEMFSDLYKLDVVSLRFFNVFGPRQKGAGAYANAISSWCCAAFENRPLRSDGTGDQTRDLCYVGEIVNACIAAASHTEKFAGEKINVCTGTQRSNNSILKFFLDRNDNLKIVNAPKRQGDVDHILGSDIKMRKYLGNCATIRFDEALDITLKSWGL
jgi:UDP-glucose 4-epimerase